MKLLLKLSIATLAIFAASKIIPGVYVEDLVTAIVVALVLGTPKRVCKTCFNIAYFSY
ncbi:MAG: hypothetical protein KatS3mg101_0678 [Patescibacteria group bacterium]|nr:MAG: hypothetical protein KatS3mg101_0678 [Patescibacteria group bacterium]